MAETRRDRLRAATMLEITQTARRLLVEQGLEAVTLRAIAREMGMTAPALYRYFDSHSELLTRVIGDIFNDLTDDLQNAIREVPPGDMAGKFLAAARQFRRWALDHEREYTLLFGNPLPGLDVERDDFAAESSRRFGWTFLNLFMELWHKTPFPVRSDLQIDPFLRDQLDRYRRWMGIHLPLGAVLTFIQSWMRLQGSVSLEVLGHMSFALNDPTPLFELMLEEMAPILGLTYSPPAMP